MQRSAIRALTTGGPEVLEPVTLELPEVEGDSVRAETAYAGVNFWDVMQRRGDVPLPADGVPGVEGMGIVVAAGPDAPADLVGRRVAWSKVASSYADVVQGPAGAFVPVPDAVTDETAAGALMQGVTAQYLATSTTDLSDGQVAVVTAAAGGVGRLLTQLLRSRGVRVIGVVGSAAKAGHACADDVIVESSDLREGVRRIAPAGADAVFDAGGAAVEGLLGLLRPRGTCVVYGSAGGGAPQSVPLGALAAGSFFLTRTAGRDYASGPGEWRARADDVMAAVAAGGLEVVVTEVLPLAEAARAHSLLESRATTGKLLLRTR